LYQDKPKSRSKHFLTPQDIADIVVRYQAGETQQIGTRYGISKTRVATVRREQGITVRRQGLNDEQVSEAATFYASGKSLAVLCYPLRCLPHDRRQGASAAGGSAACTSRMALGPVAPGHIGHVLSDDVEVVQIPLRVGSQQRKRTLAKSP
jgi:hypothetical protein